MTAQLRARGVRQPHPFRRAQSFEILLGLAQARLKAADAETREDRLDLVHDPRLLGDQVPALAVWPSCVLLLDRRDRHHAAMAPLAAQPAQKGTRQQFGVEAISLRAPVFARHCDARGMDDISLDIACPQPARQPEAVTSGLISTHDALDLPPRRAGIELLERLAFDAGNNRRNKPLRLAHLDYGDDRAILLEGGERPARVKWS